ncbi:flagellar filament capping protein FliD [Nocardioides sp. InS609-2]|uniref:flagellar filament capping protein FliD n=1 Tax=Nocardioides sp. InS609-2 TaxID=2760705 RepID=UPI00209B6899|nr:flagellar filament capping protein FliD [Nocardioides sp. InS609-2]
MATSSISGLASGLDTAGIVSQLMQLEATSQNRLKTKLTTEQSTLKSIQDLNAKFAALATAAGALSKPGALSPLKVTSSHEGVTVNAANGSTAGSLTLRVDQVASAHNLRFATTAATSDVVVSGGTTVSLTINGATKTLDTGDGTLGGLVKALNASGTGVRASALRLDDGSFRLSVQAATTGAASAFTLTNSDGTALLGGATVVAGQDAQIAVGSDTIHSATNTFTGLLPGIDVTVASKAVGETVTLDIASDPTAARDRAKGLVDQVNELLTQLDKLTSYDPITKKSGAFAGNSTIRDLRNQLLGAVYPGGGTTMVGVGVQTDRSGKLVFDATAFDKSYAADPAATSAAFSGTSPAGLAKRLESLGKAASDRTDGTLTSVANGSSAQIDRLKDSIASWDTRLDLRRQNLTRQFTALETALSRLNSQSNWLSGQLGSPSSQ